MLTLAKRLAAAMNASGYNTTEASDSRLLPVISKLQYLSNKGSFARLLSDLFGCNDKSNMHSLLFEATFAWHFELKGKHLVYEVLQKPSGRSTIDFLYVPSQDMHIYFELRLLQQQATITALFEKQLRESPYFGTLLNGSDQQREVVRLQQVLLGKVQDREGNPVKFFSTEPPNYNVIVVDVSQPVLGMIDKYDCILSCYGDEALPPPYRRDVFGLFQILRSSDPALFQEIAQKFDHLREMIHGILFMRRPRESNAIDFDLQCYFIRNRHILSVTAYDRILAELGQVFAVWEK
jgi:hypothetical protein